MKEFGTSILQIIGALFVSVFVFPLGFLYTIGYGIWLKKRGNRWTAILRFAWRIIDGMFAALGHFIKGLAYALDLGWNVIGGEMIEDLMTSKEDTEFTKKNVTVSATTGKLEIDGDLNKGGRTFSKVLNFAFWQKQHAKDSWLFLQAREELRKKYFESM
jgi:hypothetical protein